MTHNDLQPMPATDPTVKIVVITPNGTASFTLDRVSRPIISRLLFNDWRKKNPGDYTLLILKKLSEEEREKLPKISDPKMKICEIIGNECECFIDGVAQDVKFMMEKYWNQLNHNK